MPESSDHPNPDPPLDPPRAPEPAPELFLPAPLAPAPRANPQTAYSIQQLQESAPDVSLNDLIALARTLSGGGAAAPTPTAPVKGEAARQPGQAGRILIPREQKKFHRREARAEGTAEAPPDAEAGSAPAGSAPTAPTPVRTAAPTVITVTRNRRTRQERQFALFSVVATALAAIFLLGGGFLVWRLARPVNVKVPVAGGGSARGPVTDEPTLLSAQTFELVDRLAAATRTNDFMQALTLCEQLRGETTHIPGLDYQQALVAAQSGDSNQAMLAIGRSLAAGEQVANCHILRAALLARRGKPAQMLADYETAAQADPFSVPPFFFWGEALRRNGKPQEALTRLRQAFDRSRERVESERVQLKMRLTLIEMDRGTEFADELKAMLTLQPPPTDWLLTAAAQEMRHGNYAAAAGYLGRAEVQISPGELAEKLRDYFLYGFAYEKELARFYEPLRRVASSAAGAPKPAPSAGTGALTPPALAPQEMVSPFDIPLGKPTEERPAGSPSADSPETAPSTAPMPALPSPPADAPRPGGS